MATASLVDIMGRLRPGAEWRWGDQDRPRLPGGIPDYRVEDIVMMDGSQPPTLQELEDFRVTAETDMDTEKTRRRLNNAMLENEDIHQEMYDLVEFLTINPNVPAQIATRAQTLKTKIDSLRLSHGA